MDKGPASAPQRRHLESNKVLLLPLLWSLRVLFNFSIDRCSMFYISRSDGVLDAWDLLQQHNEPVLSIKVCDEALLSMRAHESGRFIAAGSEKGATFLIEVSENMATSLKNDKQLLTAMFERENKREKILEAKLREIKLKVKTAQLAHDDNNESKASKVSVNDSMCKQIEAEYLKAIENEKSNLFPNILKRKKRTNGEDGQGGSETEYTDGDDYDDDDESNLVSE